MEFQYIVMDVEGRTYTGIVGVQLISPRRMFVVLPFLRVVFLRIVRPYRKCQICVLPFYPLPSYCQHVGYMISLGFILGDYLKTKNTFKGIRNGDLMDFMQCRFVIGFIVIRILDGGGR